jgi:glycosyltransferase involved in cell wall biosynthesis
LQGAPPAAIKVVNRLLSEQEVAQLLASATVVVLPYTDATQSGVLAAAYALGTPVVATTVGSFPEFVRDGVSGLLVPPNDPEALAGAIRRVLLDPVLRDRLSRGADKLARTVLSWGEVVGHHFELYTDIVGKATSTR